MTAKRAKNLFSPFFNLSENPVISSHYKHPERRSLRQIPIRGSPGRPFFTGPFHLGGQWVDFFGSFEPGRLKKPIIL
jgi:hypothetical protein